MPNVCVYQRWYVLGTTVKRSDASLLISLPNLSVAGTYGTSYGSVGDSSTVMEQLKDPARGTALRSDIRSTCGDSVRFSR